MKRGWVRITPGFGVMYAVEGLTSNAVWAGVMFLRKHFPNLREVQVIIEEPTWYVEKLKGNRLAMFLKNRSIPSKMVAEAKTSYTGWANVRTGNIVSSPRATFHYKLLKQYWKEMGLDEVNAMLATDAYGGPAQREAYSKGWMRWFFDTGLAVGDDLHISASRDVIAKALPMTLKLIKEFQPRALYVDEVHPDKDVSWRSASLNAGDLPAIRKWFQQRPTTKG